MSAMQIQVDKLVRRFDYIARERMQGLPFYNQALQVEAAGFRETEQGYLGALITPWFINIVLLFIEPPQSDALAGHWCSHALPSGKHDFMIGEDEAIGRYDFISLASPTTRYKTQEQARGFALQKLAPLFGLPGKEPVDEKPVNFIERPHHTMSRRRFFMGDTPTTPNKGTSE